MAPRRLAARIRRRRASLPRLAPLLLWLAACGGEGVEPARGERVPGARHPAEARAELATPLAARGRTRSSTAGAPDGPGPEAPAPVGLAGLVLGPDGRGVPGVGLRVRGRAWDPVELSTDAGGRFEHTLPPPGRAWLGLDPRTLPHGLLVRHGGRSLDVELGIELWLEPPLAGPLGIELVEAAALEGGLAFPDGTPVTSGEVVLESLDERRLWREARVGADGRFVLERLHPGRYLVFMDWWVPMHRAAPVPSELALAPGQRGELELVLGAGPCALDGRVLGSDGQGYAGASVEVLVEVDEGRPRPIASCTIDEQGRYAFEGLPPGRVLVRFPCCPGSSYDEAPPPRALDLEPGAVARLSDLQLECTAVDRAAWLEEMLPFTCFSQ